MKPLLELGHGWVIASHIQQWLWLLVQPFFQLIHVGKMALLIPIWARLNIKTVFPRYGDSHVKDRLIFNMGIPILVRRHLSIETGPWSIYLIKQYNIWNVHTGFIYLYVAVVILSFYVDLYDTFAHIIHCWFTGKEIKQQCAIPVHNSWDEL